MSKLIIIDRSKDVDKAIDALLDSTYYGNFNSQRGS